MPIKLTPTVSKIFPDAFNLDIQAAGKEPLPTTGIWELKARLEQDVFEDDVLKHSYVFVVYNHSPTNEPPELMQSVITKLEITNNEKGICDLNYIDHAYVGFNSTSLYTYNKFVIVCANLEWKKDHQISDLETKIWFLNIDPQNKFMDKISISPTFLDHHENEHTLVRWFTFKDHLCIMKCDIVTGFEKWHRHIYYTPLSNLIDATPDSKINFYHVEDFNHDSEFDIDLLQNSLIKLTGIF
jgi:hypothetical protein